MASHREHAGADAFGGRRDLRASRVVDGAGACGEIAEWGAARVGRAATDELVGDACEAVAAAELEGAIRGGAGRNVERLRDATWRVAVAQRHRAGHRCGASGRERIARWHARGHRRADELET